MASFIIKDTRIFTGERFLECGTVLVKDGLIVSISDSNSPTSSLPEEDIPIVSAPGHTLIPGLIDAHIHADKGKVLAIEQALRFGVTTVLDMHNEANNVAKLKELAKTRKDVADFKAAVFGATVDQGWPSQVVTSHDKSEQTRAEIATWPKLTSAHEADHFVEQNIKDGADYIKLFQESGNGLRLDVTFPLPSTSLQAAIVAAAHRHHVLAVAHAMCLHDTIAMLEAGVDGLTHTIFDQAPTPALIAAYKKNDAFVIPTLAAINSLTGEGQKAAKEFATDKRVEAILDSNEKKKMGGCLHVAAETSKAEYAYESIRQLKGASIDIVCGSDAVSPVPGVTWGLSLHHELHLLVEKVGFTPEEALRSATSVTARRFGMNDRGIIGPGRKADLVLVKGNPLSNIGDLLNLEMIWRDGWRL